MIIYDDIKIPEVACAFIVGFIHKTPDKSNLTNQKISEISERIEFLCPNISEDSRKRIRQAIFNEPEIRSSIHEWNSMVGEFVDERYLILQGIRESIPQDVRITEEMKFGFFLGMAIWTGDPEEEWKEKRSRFLSKIAKPFESVDDCLQRLISLDCVKNTINLRNSGLSKNNPIPTQYHFNIISFLYIHVSSELFW